MVYCELACGNGFALDQQAAGWSAGVAQKKSAMDEIADFLDFNGLVGTFKTLETRMGAKFCF